MLTNVQEYVEISHNVKSEFMPPRLNSLSGNSTNIFRLKISFLCQMVRSKNQKVKNGLKLNDM